jgi:hypothetical protein
MKGSLTQGNAMERLLCTIQSIGLMPTAPFLMTISLSLGGVYGADLSSRVLFFEDVHQAEGILKSDEAVERWKRFQLATEEDISILKTDARGQEVSMGS